jgi:Mg-chelatase subunit ChlD/anti-sigma factor RsiW
MNPEQQNHLEGKLTALLLGELPASEAFELGRAIERDPELAKLYQRLEKTIGLVKETSVAPAAADESQAPAPVKLSDQRRQALLQQFKTVSPRTFAKVPRARREVRVLQVAAVFATLGIVVAVAVFSFNSRHESFPRIKGEENAAPASTVAFKRPSQTEVVDPSRDLNKPIRRELAETPPAQPGSQAAHAPIVLPAPEPAAATTGDRFYRVTAGSEGDQQRRGSVALNSKSEFPGAPEWIGAVDRPVTAHSDTNAFIGGYAYNVTPTRWGTAVSGVTNRTSASVDSLALALRNGAGPSAGQLAWGDTDSDGSGALKKDFKDGSAPAAPGLAFKTWEMAPTASPLPSPQPANSGGGGGGGIGAGSLLATAYAANVASLPASETTRPPGDITGSTTVRGSKEAETAAAVPAPPAVDPATGLPLPSAAPAAVEENGRGARPGAIDPATGLPVPMPEIAAIPKTPPEPQVRAFKIDPAKLSQALETAPRPFTPVEQPPGVPRVGTTFGGGGAVGRGIGNVTRTDGQVAVQENARKFLADSGVALDASKGERVFYDDREGRIIVSADEDKLKQIDSATRTLREPAQAAGEISNLANLRFGAGYDGNNNVANLGDVPALGRVFRNGTTPSAGKPLAAAEVGAAASYRISTDSFVVTNTVVAGNNSWDANAGTKGGKSGAEAPRQQIVLPPAEQQLTLSDHDGGYWFEAEKKKSGAVSETVSGSGDASAQWNQSTGDGRLPLNRASSQAGTAVAVGEWGNHSKQGAPELADGSLQQLNRSKLQNKLTSSTTPAAGGNVALSFSTTPAQAQKAPDVAGATEEGRRGKESRLARADVALITQNAPSSSPLPQKDADLAPRKPSTNAPIHQPEVTTAGNAFSTFSLNISDVSFKLAAASLEKGALPEPASVRSEEFINAFDYHDQEPSAGVPVGFAWERAQYPFAQNRDVLRFSIKTAAEGRLTGSPLNVVLLLDNSGSMERADRVHIIRESLRVLASQLQAQDKLSVVLFSRTARLLVDGVSGTNATKVAEEVSGLTPEGGTNLEEAMNLAYQTAARHYLANGINRVVLLTDGAANLGDVEPESLKQKVETNRKQGIALDCFGIGWEGYNDDLLEVLSRNGDGRYGFINTPEEAASEFARQLAGALHVAASDVKVQVEFNPARVKTWRQVGYARHQLTKEQFRDNTVDAAEIAAAESGNALYVIEVNPNGDGPLGTVRVRFKVPGTSDYREHEWAVPYTGNALALEQSSPAMRLAGTASAFSEWLAANPYAGEINLDRLLGYLRGVPETYGADARPKKLEWMLRQTKSLAGQ